jgi:hypothetical protein
MLKTVKSMCAANDFRNTSLLGLKRNYKTSEN